MVKNNLSKFQCIYELLFNSLHVINGNFANHTNFIEELFFVLIRLVGLVLYVVVLESCFQISSLVWSLFTALMAKKRSISRF